MVSNSNSSIDRAAVVRRHNVVMRQFEPLSPLSGGNGEFAFTVDPTGLQTFPEIYEPYTPLCTQSNWGWHTVPMPPHLRGKEIRYSEYDTYGRKVGYLTRRDGQEELYNWLRENPHRLHLGRIALKLRKPDGSPATPDDLKNLEQTLDLWTGIIASRFSFQGQPVMVQTCCAGESDAVAVKIESPLMAAGRLGVLIAFPYGSSDRNAADWSAPEAHETRLVKSGANRADLSRKLDEDRYHVSIAWSDGAQLANDGRHGFTIRTTQPVLEFACGFAVAPVSDLPSPQSAFARSREFWNSFWSTGGAIDLSGSTDSRAAELERRTVLSQYLTRVNCAGSLPPQETGLTCNSWFGKFHLEMHWWHAAHFAQWSRTALLEKSLDFYRRTLPVAQENAHRQGYEGARWTKMVGPDGRDVPSPIGPLLIWHQPHPLYYAELCYRAQPNPTTLQSWQQVVEESADFMTSFAVRDGNGRYVLGPPVKTVPEFNDAKTTRNPTFELTYWRMGLRIAQQWRQRLGLAANPRIDDVLKNLSPLPTMDGLYLMQEGQRDVYTNANWEHPSMVGAMGMLSGDGVDGATMRRTVEKVMQVWQWDRCWGWDFPMTAMAAARSGRPDLAIQALLIESPKNKCFANGHVYQRENLTLYLPANGGFLSAIAMMAAGWDGGPETHAPGFPPTGWNVRHEGLVPML